LSFETSAEAGVLIMDNLEDCGGEKEEEGYGWTDGKQVATVCPSYYKLSKTIHLSHVSYKKMVDQLHA
jgi:hypothetical protein